MTRRCPDDATEVFDDAAAICGVHLCPLITVDKVAPPVAAENPAVTGYDVPSQETGPHRTGWSTAECWRCGTRSPNSDNVECLVPTCRRSLTPPAMHIRFPAGEVEVQVGDSVTLGRQGPHGRVFRDHPNISRRHAAVGVGDDGRAWIQPFATSNGTFVNDWEIPDALNRTLASGERIRFAASAAVGTVTLYDRWPTTGQGPSS
jgi:hypothetical protein